MKQRITAEQLSELTDVQKEKLREWWKPQKGDFYIRIDFDDDLSFLAFDEYKVVKDKALFLPLLSIGQMFELLDDFSLRVNLNRYDYEWLLEK